MKKFLIVALALGLYLAGSFGCHAEAGVDPNDTTSVGLAH